MLTVVLHVGTQKIYVKLMSARVESTQDRSIHPIGGTSPYWIVNMDIKAPKIQGYMISIELKITTGTERAKHQASTFILRPFPFFLESA